MAETRLSCNLTRPSRRGKNPKPERTYELREPLQSRVSRPNHPSPKCSAAVLRRSTDVGEAPTMTKNAECGEAPMSAKHRCTTAAAVAGLGASPAFAPAPSASGKCPRLCSTGRTSGGDNSGPCGSRTPTGSYNPQIGLESDKLNRAIQGTQTR